VSLAFAVAMRSRLLQVTRGRLAFLGAGLGLHLQSDPAQAKSTSGAGGSSVQRPQFRFGVIADIQFCDCDDASNFAGTEVRHYRGTLSQADAAAEHWNRSGVDFVVQLGDLIDGQNAGGYGAGLDFAEPQSESALARVVEALSKCSAPMYHAIGNHELYNFDWRGLVKRLQQPQAGAANGRDWHVASAERLRQSPEECTAHKFYFSWRPVEGWTFVMLNAYAVSIEQDKSSDGFRQACQLLSEHNPKCFEMIMNGVTQGDFFTGLERDEDMRFVPFNGGLGEGQLQWLREELRAAKSRGDRIVVMSHVPMC
jgi:manganese-dependent ADP-ribose/CDP-alcohol diphosphatase